MNALVCEVTDMVLSALGRPTPTDVGDELC